METDSEVIAETPDINFSENITEQDITEQETPDINFSEIVLETGPNKANKSYERFTADDSDIDDLDEPDQYVEKDDETEDLNQESNNKNNSESGLECILIKIRHVPKILTLLHFQYQQTRARMD